MREEPMFGFMRFRSTFGDADEGVSVANFLASPDGSAGVSTPLPFSLSLPDDELVSSKTAWPSPLVGNIGDDAIAENLLDN